MTRKSRIAVVVAAALMTLAGPVAGNAAATTETFMSDQGLSHGNAYASYTAHSYVNYIDTNSDHTVCPAVASGYGGYTSTPFSGGNNTAYQSALCGYGYSAWAPNPVSGYLHGAAYNPNSATDDYLYYAQYQW